MRATVTIAAYNFVEVKTLCICIGPRDESSLFKTFTVQMTNLPTNVNQLLNSAERQVYVSICSCHS